MSGAGVIHVCQHQHTSTPAHQHTSTKPAPFAKVKAPKPGYPEREEVNAWFSRFLGFEAALVRIDPSTFPGSRGNVPGFEMTAQGIQANDLYLANYAPFMMCSTNWPTLMHLTCPRVYMTYFLSGLLVQSANPTERRLSPCRSSTRR